jgi:hypothetical protein
MLRHSLPGSGETPNESLSSRDVRSDCNGCLLESRVAPISLIEAVLIWLSYPRAQRPPGVADIPTP